MADTFSTNPLLIGKTNTVQAPPLMPVPGTAVAPTPERPPFNIFSPEGSALLAQLGGALSPEGNAFTAGLAGVANQGAQGALQDQYMGQLRQDPQAQAPRFMDPKAASQTQDKAQSERQERLDFAEKIFNLQDKALKLSQSPKQFETNMRLINTTISGAEQDQAQSAAAFPGQQAIQDAKLAGLQGDLAIQTATQEELIKQPGLKNKQTEAQTIETLARAQYYSQGMKDKKVTAPVAVQLMSILPKYITPETKKLIKAGILKGDYTALFYSLNAEDQPKVMTELNTLMGGNTGISAGLPGAPGANTLDTTVQPKAFEPPTFTADTPIQPMPATAAELQLNTFYDYQGVTVYYDPIQQKLMRAEK